MNSPLKQTLLLSLGLFLFTSCAPEVKYSDPSSHYSETSPSRIEILSEVPQRSYIELGEIKEKGNIYSSEEGMLDNLRHTAATMGADAVIIQSSTKSGYDFLEGQRKRIIATAIKWKAGPSESKPSSSQTPPVPATSNSDLPTPQPIH